MPLSKFETQRIKEEISEINKKISDLKKECCCQIMYPGGKVNKIDISDRKFIIQKQGADKYLLHAVNADKQYFCTGINNIEEVSKLFIDNNPVPGQVDTISNENQRNKALKIATLYGSSTLKKKQNRRKKNPNRNQKKIAVLKIEQLALQSVLDYDGNITLESIEKNTSTNLSDSTYNIIVTSLDYSRIEWESSAILSGRTPRDLNRETINIQSSDTAEINKHIKKLQEKIDKAGFLHRFFGIDTRWEQKIKALKLLQFPPPKNVNKRLAWIKKTARRVGFRRSASTSFYESETKNIIDKVLEHQHNTQGPWQKSNSFTTAIKGLSTASQKLSELFAYLDKTSMSSAPLMLPTKIGKQMKIFSKNFKMLKKKYGDDAINQYLKKMGGTDGNIKCIVDTYEMLISLEKAYGKEPHKIHAKRIFLWNMKRSNSDPNLKHYYQTYCKPTIMPQSGKGERIINCNLNKKIGSVGNQSNRTVDNDKTVTATQENGNKPKYPFVDLLSQKNLEAHNKAHSSTPYRNIDDDDCRSEQSDNTDMTNYKL